MDTSDLCFAVWALGGRWGGSWALLDSDGKVVWPVAKHQQLCQTRQDTGQKIGFRREKILFIKKSAGKKEKTTATKKKAFRQEKSVDGKRRPFIKNRYNEREDYKEE